MEAMNNEQYTNIMVALGKLEEQGRHTNEHLKTLNGKVAANVQSIKHLERDDIEMKNDMKILLGESKTRQDNTQWWKRHISGIVVSVALGIVLLLLQLTGIININI